MSTYSKITIFLFLAFIASLTAYLYMFRDPSNLSDDSFINDPSIVIYFKKPVFEIGETVEFYVNTQTQTCLEDKTLDFQIKKPNGEYVRLSPPCSGVVGTTKGRFCKDDKVTDIITTCTDIMQVADQSCTSVRSGLKGEWQQIDFNANDHYEILKCSGVFFDKPTDAYPVEPGIYTLELKSPTNATLQKPFRIAPVGQVPEAKRVTIMDFLRNLIELVKSIINFVIEYLTLLFREIQKQA